LVLSLSTLLVAILAQLILVFGYSATTKVRSRAAQRAFAESLRPLRLIPEPLLRPVAAVVSSAEAAVAACLGWSALGLAGLGLAGLGRAGPELAGLAGLALATVLLAVLTGGIAVAVRGRTGARCACFGRTERPLGVRHLVRNGILLSAAVAGLLLLLFSGAPPADPPGALLGAGLGAVSALLVTRLDDLVELFAPPSHTHFGR
jgi:methylamine utilization protein MauE